MSAALRRRPEPPRGLEVESQKGTQDANASPPPRERPGRPLLGAARAAVARASSASGELLRAARAAPTRCLRRPRAARVPRARACRRAAAAAAVRFAARRRRRRVSLWAGAATAGASAARGRRAAATAATRRAGGRLPTAFPFHNRRRRPVFCARPLSYSVFTAGSQDQSLQ